MLKISELTKKYSLGKSKEVIALNNINLSFPEKGMVFILGKSGSGKSTLLNSIGGIDSFTSGDIIVDGKSLKSFTSSELDSYRNTYIGFIFQEYNVLNDFNVSDNISFALKLQGENVDNEKLNNILKSLDLENFENRKINELSGGQLQRVAIARTLIKKPKIILCDEPTGALDSKTGNQIFKILKEISNNHLVIVVTHDEDFAYSYADRIIELADGYIISDKSRQEDINDVSKLVVKDGLTISDGKVFVSKDLVLSDDDMSSLMNSLEKDKKLRKGHFVKTPNIVVKNNNPISLKTSKLSFKNALIMALTSLKTKPFRLILTILLTCISFSMFGLALILDSYSSNDALISTLQEGIVDYTNISKGRVVVYGDEIRSNVVSMTNDDITFLNQNLGNSFYGIYKNHLSLDFKDCMYDEDRIENSNYYSSSLSGLTTVSEDDLKGLGYTLIGSYPTNDFEILITQYTFSHFETTGMVFEDGSYISYNNISPQNVIGKSITMDEISYKITGILDTKIDMERYGYLKDSNEYEKTQEGMIYNEFRTLKRKSFMNLGYVTNNTIDMLNASFVSPFGIVLNNTAFLSFNYTYEENDKTNQKQITGSYLTNTINNDLYTVYGKNSLDSNEIIISWIDIFNYAKNNKLLGDRINSLNSDEITNNKDEIIAYLNENITDILNNMVFDGTSYVVANEMISSTSLFNIKVVGFHSNDESIIIANDNIYNIIADRTYGKYSSAISILENNKSYINKLIDFTQENNDGIYYSFENQVTETISSVNDRISLFSSLFKYLGIFLGCFSILLLYNFISISISNKKKEMGIIKALGANKKNMFLIFFNEAEIISIFNVILSIIVVFIGTNVINNMIKTTFGLLINILNVHFINIFVLILISILVGFVSCLLPIIALNKKTPLDLLKDR